MKIKVATRYQEWRYMCPMLLAFVWVTEMSVDWCADDEVFDDDSQDDDWIQFANITSEFPVYIIEVLMVVDYAIYRRYAELRVTRLFTSQSRR